MLISIIVSANPSGTIGLSAVNVSTPAEVIVSVPLVVVVIDRFADVLLIVAPLTVSVWPLEIVAPAEKICAPLHVGVMA